jgi:hypothetical protein
MSPSSLIKFLDQESDQQKQMQMMPYLGERQAFCNTLTWNDVDINLIR